MKRKTQMDAFGASSMVAFALLLAANQVVIKLTNDGFQPVFQTGIRSVVGATALLIWMRFKGIPLRIETGTFGSGLLLGGLFAGEFLCLFIALDLTTVARSSIIFYSMPVWLSLLGHFLLPAERVSKVKGFGLLLAMVGVVIAVAGRGAAGDEASFLGDMLALIAAMCWAGIALTARITPIAHVRIEMQLMWQLVVSAVVLLLLSFFFGPLLRDFSTIHVISVLGQGVVVVFAAFLFWFWLIKTYPASSVASFSFLSPVFGVLLGWLLLGEKIGPGAIAALGCVAVGLVMINWPTRSGG